MSRVLPQIPRGPARKRAKTPQLALTCPRISPEYQFRATVALIKPQFKQTVAHRDGRQTLPRHARRCVYELLDNPRRRFRTKPLLKFRTADGNLLQIEFNPADARAARSVAVAMSRAMPRLWFVLSGRLLHAGRFYRRVGRYRLVPASLRVPRLPRELFLELRPML